MSDSVMRRRLYREGADTADKRRLEDTTFHEGVPLTTSIEKPDSAYSANVLVGWVDDIRRGDDGWVYGDLHLQTDRDLDLSVLACQATFMAPQDPEMVDGVLVLRQAVLRGVHLGTHPCWEGMVGQ